MIEEKKGQVVVADVASGVSDTEILMASYIEDNTSQSKNWIFYSGSKVHVCFQKELFNSLNAKVEGIVKMVEARLARSSALGQSRLQKEMGQCVFWKQSGMSRRHGTI